MPRKGPAPKRKTVADPKYHSVGVTQLINRVMNDGKRSTAEKIVYDAFEGIRERTGADPVQVFKKALENVSPAAGRLQHQRRRSQASRGHPPDGRGQPGLRPLPLVARATPGTPTNLRFD